VMKINFNLGSFSEYFNLLKILKNNAQIRLSNLIQGTENPQNTQN
jgi:hypothetical protein